MLRRTNEILKTASAFFAQAELDRRLKYKCVYGARKMWHAARRAGLPLGRDQVGRLMRIAGIQACDGVPMAPSRRFSGAT